MRKLFLDDSRRAPDFTWDVVRNYAEFVSYISLHGMPDMISFDHDLGQEHYDHYCSTIGPVSIEVDLNKIQIPYQTFTEKTGYDCAKWLIVHCMDNKLRLPSYMVHSMNPVGKKNIEFVLSAERRREEEETFGVLPEEMSLLK